MVLALLDMWDIPEWIEKVGEHVLGVAPKQLKYIGGIVDFLFRFDSFSNMVHPNISIQ